MLYHNIYTVTMYTGAVFHLENHVWGKHAAEEVWLNCVIPITVNNCCITFFQFCLLHYTDLELN